MGKLKLSFILMHPLLISSTGPLRSSRPLSTRCRPPHMPLSPSREAPPTWPPPRPRSPRSSTTRHEEPRPAASPVPSRRPRLTCSQRPRTSTCRPWYGSQRPRPSLHVSRPLRRRTSTATDAPGSTTGGETTQQLRQRHEADEPSWPTGSEPDEPECAAWAHAGPSHDSHAQTCPGTGYVNCCHLSGNDFQP